MSEQKIASFVDAKAITDIQTLVKELENAQRAFAPLMNEIRETSRTMGASSKDVTKMIEVFAKYNELLRRGKDEGEKYNAIAAQKKRLEEQLKNLDIQKAVEIEKLKGKIATLTAAAQHHLHVQAASTTGMQNAIRAKITFREQTRRLVLEIKRQRDIERGSQEDGKRTEMTYRAKSARLAQLREAFKDAGRAAQKELIPQIRALDKELKKIDRSLGIHTRDVGNYGRMMTSLIPGLSRFNTGFGAMGIAVMGVVATITALSNAVKYGFGVIKEYEQANADLASIMMTTTRNTQALQEQSMKLGLTTEYTASQVTLAQKELAKLGFGQQTILNMTQSLLGFATALDASLPAAAKLAGQTLRAFNLSSQDTEGALTMMASAANKSAMDFAFLERSMAIVGASASVAKVPLRDTLALLGTLANSGLDASRAATALRNIFLYLSDDTKKLGKALKGTEMNAGSISKAFTQLRKEGVDLADMFQLTDKRAVNALAVLIQNSEQVIKLRDNITDLTGTLDMLRATRLDTVEGEIKLLKSAWDNFWLSFKESTPIVRDTLSWITEKLVEIGRWREKQGQARESSNAYGTDFVDQKAIETFLKSQDKRLRDAAQIFRDAQGKTFEEADAAYKNLLKVQADIRKEAEASFRQSQTYVVNYSKQIETLNKVAGNNKEKKIARDLTGLYETLGVSYKQLNTYSAASSEAQRMIDSGTLDTEQVKQWQAQQQLAEKRKAAAQTRIAELHEQLEKTYDAAMKDSGWKPTDFADPSKWLSGGVFGDAFKAVTGNKISAKFAKAAYDQRTAARAAQGNLITEERKLAGVNDLIAESLRINTEGALEGANYTPPSKDGGRSKAQLDAERRAAREQALSDAEALAEFTIKINELKEAASRLRMFYEEDSEYWDSRNEAVKEHTRILKDVAQLEMQRKDQDITQKIVKENIGITGKVIDPNVIDPITGEAQTDAQKATLNQRMANYKAYLTNVAELDRNAAKAYERINDQMVKWEEESIKERLKLFREGLERRQQEVETDRKKQLEISARLYRKGSLNEAGLKEEDAKTNVLFDERLVEQTKLYYESFVERLDLPATLKQTIQDSFDKFLTEEAPQMTSESKAAYERETGRTYSGTAKKGGTWFRRIFGTGTKRDEAGNIDEAASTSGVAEVGKKLTSALNLQEVKMVEQLYGQMMDVISGFYDLEIQKIDEVMAKERERYEEQQRLLDQSLEHLTENYNAGLLSEENFEAQRRQNEMEKEALAKKQAADEKKREEEKRKLQVQQAKWNKANSIAQTVMSTAQGVASALTVIPTPVGLMLASTVGAIGAAQIALIASQQIPKYAQGTSDHKGGLMMVGDGGVPEYVVTPDNKVTVTDDKPMLMDAPAHTQVFKDDKAFLDYLFEKDLNVDRRGETVINNINVDTDYIEQRKLLRSIDRRLSSASENEKYRLRYMRHNKLFDQW